MAPHPPLDGPIGRRAVLRGTGVVGLALATGAATAGTATATATPAPAQAGAELPALPLTGDLSGVLPPTQLTVRCKQGGALSLAWNEGASAGTGLRYAVHVDGVRVALVRVPWVTLTTLEVGSTHAFAVSLTDDSGVESERTAETVRSVPADADVDLAGVPAVLTAVPGLNGAQLRWVHPVAGAPAEYRVLRAGDPTPLVVLGSQPTDPDDPASPRTRPDPSAFVPGLPAGQSVELLVTAHDAAGAQLGEAANRVRVVPLRRALALDRTPPTAPTGLVVTAVREALQLRWTASRDTGSGVRGYSVLLDGQFVQQVLGATKVTVGRLDPARAREVTVVAFDQAGNVSAASAAVTAQPKRSGPAVVSPPAVERFTAAGGRLRDPAGADFVPVGANVPGSDFFWIDPVRGRAEAAAGAWAWSAVRVNCGMRDWGSVGGSTGFLYLQNNLLLDVVSEYTARGVVVVLSQHARGGSDPGTHLPTAPGSAPDSTGRSVEEGVTDWWVEVATLFADNPRVWFNLVNEPGADLAALEEQYRRMLSRVRAVAPLSTVVLDAASFANDIPNTTRIGAGPIATEDSFVLSRMPSLVRDLGPGAGYGPLVASLHLYSRWPVNYGPGGTITDAQLADRLRDYLVRARAAGVPVLVGETGVEPSHAAYDAAVVRVGLYERGTDPVTGQVTGVLQEQRTGVLPWHVARVSGMSVALPSRSWDTVTSRSGTNPAPQAGTALWDYAHLLAGG